MNEKEKDGLYLLRRDLLEDEQTHKISARESKRDVDKKEHINIALGIRHAINLLDNYLNKYC